MTIFDDIEAAERLGRARSQPNLEFVPFSIHSLLDDIRRRLFPDITHSVRICFVSRGPLACIAYNTSHATIYVHQLLNRHDTPKSVMTLFIKHELLHLRIKPSKVEGNRRAVSHPPEFWEAEKAIAPERKSAWTWIWGNFFNYLKNRPRLERIDVLPSWRRAWTMSARGVEELTRGLEGAEGMRCRTVALDFMVEVVEN